MLSEVEEISKMIGINDLEDKSDRTLLFGYTCERITWHVYIKNKEIIVLLYTPHSEKPEILEVFTNQGYVPNKRLYPARCDFDFCKILKEHGVHCTFTTWEENITEKKYYGKTMEYWDDKETKCPICGCEDGNHAQECITYYNAGYGKRK